MAMKPAGLIGTSRPGNRFCRVRNCPRTKVTLGRTPLGLEPPLHVSRALRWPGRDRKKTLESSISKVPALHREAEHDATKRILAVSILYIRGLATACKGSVATLQHPVLFTEGYLSSG